MTMTEPTEAKDRPPVDVGYVGSEGDLLADDEPAAEPERPDVEEFDVGRALALVDNREAAEVSLFPERSELEALAGLAVTFAASGLVPRDLRGKPNDVLVVLLTARELRIDYMTALRECAPINGKVTLSPKLRIAMILQRGVGDVWYDPANNAATATVYGQRTGSDRVAAYTFTWDDAIAAGLADARCTPNDVGTGIVHWSGSSSASCKCDMYRKYGRNMLKWRAGGYLCDEVFPDVGTGLYSAEELGGTVDEDGRAVLDVASTEGLPGMARIGADGRRVAASGSAPPEESHISPEDLADLERRIPALPEGGVAALRELWARSLPKPQELLARQVKTAQAMVASIEKRAEGGEWGAWSNWSAPRDEEKATAPTAEDLQAGAGKTPHDLARERRAREAAAEVEATAAALRQERGEEAPVSTGEGDDGGDVPTASDPAGGQEGADEAEQAALDAFDAAVAAPGLGDLCSGCQEPFQRTASGKNSPGPLGRDAAHPAFHKGCAPFD